jgi:hypothetical protein
MSRSFCSLALAGLLVSACASIAPPAPLSPRDPADPTAPEAASPPAKPTLITGEGEAAPDSAAEVYTCSMHPEVKRTEPGACSLCGMALVPSQRRPEVRQK